MGVFYNAVSGVLIILIMIALGFILARNDWFDSKMTSMIARLVTQVALPAYMISTIMEKFTAQKLLTTLPDLFFQLFRCFCFIWFQFSSSSLPRFPKCMPACSCRCSLTPIRCLSGCRSTWPYLGNRVCHLF